jgi:branched-chain amino acid transport system ATP-binding protein
VNKGEIVGLIGPNNAGKSTLLKTIAGLLHTKEGKVMLNGQDLKKLSPHEIVESGLTLVPEGRQIFGEMTVEENLLLGAYLSKARQQRSANLKWVYSLFPVLRDRRKTRSEKLSGGEAQMLALGRGLMSLPEVLLLDEPSLGLGPIPLGVIFGALRKLNSAGLTILLVEQNIRISMTISHRGYVLHNGTIVLSDNSRNLMKSNLVKRIYLGVT